MVDLKEEEDDKDGLEYETEAPSTVSYITLPSTGGCSEPSPHPSHSSTPKRSNPENNAVLRTAEIKGCIEVFLEEAEEDMELDDLSPLENITLIPIPNLIIPGFIPFAVSTSQCHIPPKSLLQKVFHPYKDSVWCRTSSDHHFLTTET